MEQGGGGGRLVAPVACSGRDEVSELLLGVGEGSRLVRRLRSACGLTGWLREEEGFCLLNALGLNASPSDSLRSSRSGTFKVAPSSLFKLQALVLARSSGLWNGNEESSYS